MDSEKPIEFEWGYLEDSPPDCNRRRVRDTGFPSLLGLYRRPSLWFRNFLIRLGFLPDSLRSVTGFRGRFLR